MGVIVKWLYGFVSGFLTAAALVVLVQGGTVDAVWLGNVILGAFVIGAAALVFAAGIRSIRLALRS